MSVSRPPVPDHIRKYIQDTFHGGKAIEDRLVDGKVIPNLRRDSGGDFAFTRENRQTVIVTESRLTNDLGPDYEKPPETKSVAEPTKPAPAAKADGKTEPAKS
jgi:hypothetical protein